MKVKSILFPFVIIAIVAGVSYYIGSSMRGCDRQSIPLQTDAAEIESDERIAEADSSQAVSEQTEAILAEFERKRQEIEEYYADRFGQLRQDVETTLKQYDAVDRAAYAWFTEQLNNTVSTSSGYTSMSGYVSPSGSISTHGSYNGTTHTEVVGKPSVEYGRHAQGMSEAIRALMDEYELDFEHFKRRRACALSDLNKEKEQALAAVRSQGVNRSVQPTAPKAPGTVTGVICNGGAPLTIINGEVLREGQNTCGVVVVKIRQDSVEFERGGTRWSQKVNEPPSPNWP